MTGILLLAAWAAIGVALASTRRIGNEPATAWVVAGAVFGPLWLFITLDQRLATQLHVAGDSSEPSRYRLHDRLHDRTHDHDHDHEFTRPERTHDTHQHQHV